MTITKTWKFIWCHIHLINILSKEELDRYAQSVSFSDWHDDIKRLLMRAIEIRRQDLTPTNINCMVWQEELTEVS